MRHLAPWTLVGLTLLAMGLSSLGVTEAQAGSSNSLMDISTDGKLLACSNRDSGSVSIVDLATRKTVREIPVGHNPEGVSFLGATHALAVAIFRDDEVVFVDGDSGKELARTAVFDEPYGVVSTQDGARVYVTLSYPGQVVEIDTTSHAIVRTWEAGQTTRGIALSPDDSRVYITEYYTGIARAFDRATGKQVEEWIGSEQDNLARQIVVHPSRPKVYIPHQRSKTTVAHGNGSIFPYVSILDVDSPAETRRKRMQMDSFNGVFVVANPWEVAISTDGHTLYVVFSGTDDMFVCEVLDDNYREIRHEQTIPLGANPRAVRVSPDGLSFFVYNALDFHVVQYSTRSLQAVATIPVCQSPLDEETLLGKKMFYSANQPMVGATLDLLFQLPPRWGFGWPRVAATRRAARHPATVRPYLDAPAALVRRPGRGTGLRTYDSRSFDAGARPRAGCDPRVARQAESGVVPGPRRSRGLHEHAYLRPQPARQAGPQRVRETRSGPVLQRASRMREVPHRPAVHRLATWGRAEAARCRYGNIRPDRKDGTRLRHADPAGRLPVGPLLAPWESEISRRGTHQPQSRRPTREDEAIDQSPDRRPGRVPEVPAV